MLNKRTLLELLWGVVIEDPAALAMRLDAAKSKNKYWASSEWIFIKDIEVRLKGMHKEMSRGNFDPNTDVVGLILSEKSAEQIADPWVSESIAVCRQSLNELSNPE